MTRHRTARSSPPFIRAACRCARQLCSLLTRVNRPAALLPRFPPINETQKMKMMKTFLGFLALAAAAAQVCMCERAYDRALGQTLRSLYRRAVGTLGSSCFVSVLNVHSSPPTNAHAGGRDPHRSTQAAVVDLTPDNFDAVVNGDKAVLVEFYAPWWYVCVAASCAAGPVCRTHHHATGVGCFSQ